MKVLHISTTDDGGAGKGMMNLHLALLHSGIDSKVLVAHKFTNCNTVFTAIPNIHLYKWSRFAIIRVLQKLLRKCGIGLTEVEKIRSIESKVPSQFQSSCFTSPITCYDLSSNQLVQDADIIHLHWVSDFVDIVSFFSKVNKPIIWTLRDENPGLGGFHYVSEKKDIYYSYKEIEDYFISIKKAAIESCQHLRLIALSDVMVDFVKSIDYLACRPLYKIYNLIDVNSFYHINREQAKSALGISEGIFVISFVSVYLRDKRKCLKELIDAISLLKINILLLAVGQNDFFDTIPDNVICLGSIVNDRLMSLVYNASDVFVTPSLQESFGKTTIEALLCGTPVISSKAGIASEVINDDNGILLKEISSECIADALMSVYSSTYDSVKIREDIIRVINPDDVVKQHIKCYTDAVTRIC